MIYAGFSIKSLFIYLNELITYIPESLIEEDSALFEAYKNFSGNRFRKYFESSDSFGFSSDEEKKEFVRLLHNIDILLDRLPDQKLEEFAKSEHYDIYKKILRNLGFV